MWCCHGNLCGPHRKTKEKKVNLEESIVYKTLPDPQLENWRNRHLCILMGKKHQLSRLDGHLTLLGGAETQQEMSCLFFFQHIIRHFALTEALCVLICTWCIKPIQPMQKLQAASSNPLPLQKDVLHSERMGKCRIYDSHPDHL